MEENKITVLKVEAGKEPEVIQIDNKLWSMQEQVGGLISIVDLYDGCVVVLNDEGKINKMSPNRWIGEDIICGSFFICEDTEDGELISLSQSNISKYKSEFAIESVLSSLDTSGVIKNAKTTQLVGEL